MWVFTTDGFFSAVEHKEDPSIIVVRTRTAQDAESLRDRLADMRCHVPVQVTPTADYGWRLFVPRGSWSLYLQNMVEAIDYTNFKNAVATQQGLERADIYHDVWHVMYEFQEDNRRG
jgi:hypothetical protein